MDEKHVDPVVLDVMMPKMDGYAFTETVRQSNSALSILMVLHIHALLRRARIVSEVNQLNRIKLMLSAAKENLKEESTV